ncbi:hypothetical protein D3H35_03220 [Cohnella faecalis]|uniref:Condensation domain-containing protein n=1 Tax=Cohnella faecalis TaxID=2315694 RepID=A0A398D0E9_9BACL|nr:hypothetical protein D3H35_03220 [Cohnella faecalis]
MCHRNSSEHGSWQRPLLKAGLFKTAEGDHLLLAVHHLVVDGISWRIVLEDLNTGYRQAMNGEAIRFPAKTDSYQTWAKALQGYANRAGVGRSRILASR